MKIRRNEDFKKKGSTEIDPVGHVRSFNRFENSIRLDNNAGSRFEFRPEGEKKTRLIFNGSFEVHGFLNKWLAYLVLKPTADQVIPRSLAILFRAIEMD